jgi:hemolysin D
MKPSEPAAVIPLPRPPRRRGSELVFLPAALEIVETPASPMGRAIAGTIALFFVVALAWAFLGSVDIIATASGKIVPTGRTKVLQPFETGVVRAIHVQDGQAVKAGDVLVELDATINGAERDRIRKDLIVSRLDVARLRAALSPAADPAAAFAPPAGASPAQVEVQESLLLNQREEIRSKLASLDRQIAQNEGNRAAVAATVNKLTLAIPLLQQRVDARKSLLDKEYAQRLQYLQEAQDLVEHQQELQVQKARLDAIIRDKPQDNSQSNTKTQAAQSDSSEPKGRELVYAARVSLDRAQMQVEVEDKLVSLTPGMAVTVEIKTGSRRVIEYVLSPILRYRQEAMRER